MCVCIYIMCIQALGGEILNVLTMLGDEEGAVEEKVSSSRSSRCGSRKE